VNVFRNEYRPLNPDEVQAVKTIKELAAELYDKMGTGTDIAVGVPMTSMVTTDPRHIALAKTKLEEAVMWATKGSRMSPAERRELLRAYFAGQWMVGQLLTGNSQEVVADDCWASADAMLDQMDKKQEAPRG